MAFSSGHTLDSINQNSRSSCVYSGMDPYAVYRAALYGAYGEGFQTYAPNLLIQGQSDQFGACSSSLYTKSCLPSGKSQGIDADIFSPVSIATETGRPQFNGIATQALLPVVGMTTDYTGLLDASALPKCTKQVHPFYWRKRGNSVPAEGMTRTKDKYRVVYTEKQKVGLEKEFKANKFITMEKKAKLSKELDLSERQIKIWFQNRRAKERRQRRKDETEKEEQLDTSDDVHDVQKQVEQLSETVCVDVLNNTTAETDFSPNNYMYPTLQSLGKPAPRSQCRFQDPGNSFYAEDIIPSAPVDHQSQISRRLTTSPTEWDSTERLLTACNVSPFTANPDWNLVYRT